MMARRGVLGVLAGAASALLSGCAIFGGSQYRFKMTVEVDTPLGVKSGSSVYQVRAMNRFEIGSETAKREWLVDGQALVIDMPEGRPIFVLMKTEDSLISDLAQMSMKTLDPAFQNDIVESAERLGGWSARSGEVARQYWPLMVRFGDLGDPRSVEKVDPEAVGVKRISLETTGNDVTTGIEKRLGWLTAQRGSLVKRDPGNFDSDQPIGVKVTEMHFSSEIGR